MTDLSRLANMAEIFSAAIVIGGIIFALIQMRQTRQQRREMAAIELFRFFGSPDFSAAYRNVLHYPDGMTADDFKQKYPDGENCAMLIATTMENIGVMMHQRIVPTTVVHHLIGSSAVILWNKLEPWVIDLRNELDNPYAFEWFQWLAITLTNLQDKSNAPAYEAHTDWVPSNFGSEI
ncbi:MAG: DUF4760 domain-containing protein [Gammaproteobacteria bacterium]|nr:DUF4760 domain-containing protein [Gammaproteobacteria bacterium]